MSLKRIRNQLERHAPAPAPGLLSHSAALENVLEARERHTDDELREIIGAGPEDVTTLSRAQLWRLARGEPYATVASTPQPPESR